MREDYTSPVGFASEPSERRRNWIARVLTLALLAFIAWLGWTKVIHPPSDNPSLGNPKQSSLPAPG